MKAVSAGNVAGENLFFFTSLKSKINIFTVIIHFPELGGTKANASINAV